jgi:DNA-binding CsgD family transcriptional regulator
LTIRDSRYAATTLHFVPHGSRQDGGALQSPIAHRARAASAARDGSRRTDKDIGTELFISESTVKTHVKSLLDKLDAMSRTEAVVLASRRGLIHL